MAMTFKLRKDGKLKAGFQVNFSLTKEEVVVVQHLADARGNVSVRQLLREIALQTIQEKISAN